MVITISEMMHEFVSAAALLNPPNAREGTRRPDNWLRTLQR